MRDIRETGYIERRERSNEPPTYDSLRRQYWRGSWREAARQPAQMRSLLRNDEDITDLINVSERNEFKPNGLREIKVKTWVKFLREDRQTVDILILNVKADNNSFRHFAAIFGNAVQDYLEERGCDDIMVDYVHVNHNQNWLNPVNVFI